MTYRTESTPVSLQRALATANERTERRALRDLQRNTITDAVHPA